MKADAFKPDHFATRCGEIDLGEHADREGRTVSMLSRQSSALAARAFVATLWRQMPTAGFSDAP